MTQPESRAPDWAIDAEAEAEGLVTDELLDKFTSISGLPVHAETRDALIAAVDAYKWAQFELQELKAESAENKALEKAAASASKLYDDLLAFLDFPGLEKRLVRISELPDSDFANSRTAISVNPGQFGHG